MWSMDGCKVLNTKWPHQADEYFGKIGKAVSIFFKELSFCEPLVNY
jgi:hypothetical protein